MTTEALRLISSRDPLTYSALNFADKNTSVEVVPVGMSDQEEYERYVQNNQGEDISLKTDGTYDEFDAAGLSDLYFADDTQQPL